MPSLAKGNNVFRPSQGTHGAASATLPLTESREDPVPTLGVNALSMDPTDVFSHDGGHTSDSNPGENRTVPPPSSTYLPSSPIFPPLSLHHDMAMWPMMPGVIPNLESKNRNSSASVSCTSTTTSTSSKHKRSALSASLLSTGKKQRTVVTGAIALNGIKESLDSFNNTIERSLLMQPDHIRPDTSPERRAKAMELFQEQEPNLP
jgi:hypothetical protein